MPDIAILVADADPVRRADLLRRLSSRSATPIGAASLRELEWLLARRRPDGLVIHAELAAQPDVGAALNWAQASGTRTVTLGLPHRPIAGIPHFPEAEAMLDHLVPGSAVAAETTTAPPPEIICIGASTGGITALEEVLGHFPPDCPPTLVVQHIRPGFAGGLVRRLDQMLAVQVVAAEDGVGLARGTVYLAAGERHLGLTQRSGLRLRLIDGDPVSGHRPSVDVLFARAAAISRTVGVSAALLTGMGADGADGMAALHAAGAHTIAQDQASSVVWGMPRVAIERGAVTQVLSLSEIGPALLRGATMRRLVP